MKNSKKFWNWLDVKNEADTPEERVLEINGEIASESWFDDDVTPKLFKDELLSGNGPITIWLNSPGGDCIAASQIYSMLMDYTGDVTIKIDGIAASAASVIAMAGTKVLMAPTALMMIHNPMTMAYGNVDEMTKAIEMLDEVKESIINAYEIRTGMSRAKLSHLMDSETWMNAGKAIELGFADHILTDTKKDAADIPAYAFSGKEAEMVLCNKITAHYRSKAQAVTPAQAAAIPSVKEEPADAGKTYDELMTRLNLIKP